MYGVPLKPSDRAKLEKLRQYEGIVLKNPFGRRKPPEPWWKKLMMCFKCRPGV
jgi:hypothetical protein